MNRLTPLLLTFLLLVPALPGAELAVVHGETNRALLEIMEGIDALPGIRATRLDLSQGLKGVDTTRESLRDYPFEAILSFGNEAQEFLADLRPDRPWIATLCEPERLNAVSAEVPPSEWVRLLVALLPRARVIQVPRLSPDLPPRLSALRGALNESGRQFLLQRPEEGEDYEALLARTAAPGTPLFLARDPALLRRRFLLRTLQTCHERRVPLLAFSRVLVDAGALAALTVTPESLAAHLVARALGRLPPPLRTRLHLNRKRAAYLGLELPRDLHWEVGGDPE